MPNGMVPSAFPAATFDAEVSVRSGKGGVLVQSLALFPASGSGTTPARTRRGPRAVQAGWQAIGLHVTMTGYSSAPSHEVRARHAGPALSAWFVGGLAVHGRLLYPLLQSSVSNANTFTSYSNPTVDALFARRVARSTRPIGCRSPQSPRS